MAETEVQISLDSMKFHATEFKLPEDDLGTSGECAHACAHTLT